MEEHEIIILGDGRTAVVCAQSAKKKYPEKSVAILISDYKCFTDLISSLFTFFVILNKREDFQFFLDSYKINVIVDEIGRASCRERV